MAEPSMERRVIICAGAAADTSHPWPGQVLQLAHPHTGEQAAFLLRDGMLQELNWFRPEFGSWFAGDTVIPGGGLVIGSPVDPLFLALPALESGKRQGGAAEGEGVFQDAEQLLQPAFGPHADALAGALDCAGACELRTLCDCKRVEETTYYRLSEARALAWLGLKVVATADALRACGGVYGGMDDSALQAYAAGIVGEYLSPAWLARLRAQLRLADPEAAAEAPLSEAGANQAHFPPGSQPAEKRSRLDPKELIKRRAAEAREEKKAAQLRRETRGMKKMSSFFARSNPPG